MTKLEYLQAARRHFVEAGSEGHYPCPPGHMSGESMDGRLCVARRLLDGDHERGSHYFWLLEIWEDIFEEGITFTNERGFATVVEAYDHLITELTPPTRHPRANPQEAIPA